MSQFSFTESFRKWSGQGILPTTCPPQLEEFSGNAYEHLFISILFLNFDNTRVATNHLRLAIAKDSDAMCRCFEVAIFHDACVKYAGKPLRDMIKSNELEGVLEKHRIDLKIQRKSLL